MLTITKLKGAEYLLRSVADGMEDYYMGAGEAPGVWSGRWAAGLGLEGVVGAEDLRALVEGCHPATGAGLLGGHRDRKVKAFDVTLSVPKSVSVLWAFGSPVTSATVSLAVVAATEVAVGFLEERAAVTRRQEGGVRRRVATGGFAVATFAHRTSRAGDPQLHTHCLVPNVVRRADGAHVAFDANPLHVWGKATGTVFLNELERLLTDRLGVAWGPERNGCREIVGFSRAQLRAFSKRTAAIEAHLEAAGEVAFESRADRMRADDRASLATRDRKDRTVTPERLRDRWAVEAATVGLVPGPAVDDRVVGRHLDRRGLVDTEVFTALADPVTGLCSTESRFGEAQVVERVAALSGGRLTVGEVVELSARFLASGFVVRLAPDGEGRRPSQWSTVELRAMEDRLLARVGLLAAGPGQPALDRTVLDAAVGAAPVRLGADQAAAVGVLCGEGPAVRVLVAPAGSGKTTVLGVAGAAVAASGSTVVAIAPTHKAVAELAGAGLAAETVARFRHRLDDGPLAAGSVVIIDEVSQLGTRDAAAVLDVVAATPGAQVWFVGDARQAQSVPAGGLADYLERLAADSWVPAVGLDRNRRQRDPAERDALARFRAGDVEASQTVRTAHGWEHELGTPAGTRQAMAEAAVADADRHGVEGVVMLAVSHADSEDLADRARAVRAGRGELRGPVLVGPGWSGPRTYAAGDRVLLHANVDPGAGVCNGATGTVLDVGGDGMDVMFDAGLRVQLPVVMVAGCRHDGTPNLSHGWVRTVAGAQGGTWSQVHLLGTPGLDRQTGYVGQSRGRYPTHTWNTRPDPEHPHSLVADDRTATDAVLDALRRDEAKTFAAGDDPWVLDRRLRAERDGHVAVMAGCPPEAGPELATARAVLARAVAEQGWAARGLEDRRQARDRLGPLTRVRRGGRNELDRADVALAAAGIRAERADRAVTDAGDRVAGLEGAVAARVAWDRQHGWRAGRVTEIDTTLAHHWAEVTLRAVRADDPLAFGARRLRDAKGTYSADLQQLDAGLPADRRAALTDAQGTLRAHEAHLAEAERRAQQAHAGLETARQRRWGRRDHAAIDQAAEALQAARQAVSRYRLAVDHAGRRASEEQAAVAARIGAERAAAPEQARLMAALGDLTAALDQTRPARVAATAAVPGGELWAALGPPPPTQGGMAAWCGIAEQVEAYHDYTIGAAQPAFGNHHPLLGPRPTTTAQGRAWDRVARLVNDAPQVIAHASAQDPGPAGPELPDHAEWAAMASLPRPRPAVGLRWETPATLDRGHGIELY